MTSLSRAVMFSAGVWLLIAARLSEDSFPEARWIVVGIIGAVMAARALWLQSLVWRAQIHLARLSAEQHEEKEKEQP